MRNLSRMATPVGATIIILLVWSAVRAEELSPQHVPSPADNPLAAFQGIWPLRDCEEKGLLHPSALYWRGFCLCESIREKAKLERFRYPDYLRHRRYVAARQSIPLRYRIRAHAGLPHRRLAQYGSVTHVRPGLLAWLSHVLHLGRPQYHVTTVHDVEECSSHASTVGTESTETEIPQLPVVRSDVEQPREVPAEEPMEGHRETADVNSVKAPSADAAPVPPSPPDPVDPGVDPRFIEANMDRDDGVGRDLPRSPMGVSPPRPVAQPVDQRIMGFPGSLSPPQPGVVDHRPEGDAAPGDQHDQLSRPPRNEVPQGPSNEAPSDDNAGYDAFGDLFQ